MPYSGTDVPGFSASAIATHSASVGNLHPSGQALMASSYE